MTVINTNIAALKAQNSSAMAQKALQTAMTRLSTGLRINSAADDASGLAVTTRMTADINGYQMAVQNANDGMSMTQTADGAMGQVSSILQRMRELAVQSSNGTISDSNRQDVQAEMTQLVNQVDSIAKTTAFNGIHLLDGTASNIQLQTGVNAGDTVSLNIANTTSKALGLQGYAVQGQLTSGRVGSTVAIANADDVLINGKAALAATFASSTTNNAQKLAAAINANVGQHGVTATAYNTLSGAAPTASNFAAGDLTINGNSVGAAGSVAQFVDNINRDVAGVSATLNSDGTIALSNNTGNDIVIGGTNASEAGFTSGTYTGYVSLASQNGSPVTVQAKDTANGYTGGAGTIMEVQSLGFNQSADGSSFTSGQVTTGALTASDDVRINGVKVGPSTDGSALAKAAAINAVSSQSGVTATASTQVLATLDFTSIPAATDVQINGSTVDLSGVKNLSDVVTDVNNAGINGLTASANNQGQLVLTSTTGANVTITDAGSFFNAAKTQDGQTGTGSFGAGLTFGGEIKLSSTTGSSIQVQNIVAGSAAKLGLAQQGGSSTLVGGALSVATQAGAQTAIKAIDAAIDRVSLNRGNLGAVQNRLQATVTNLQQISTNLTSARSAVQDTDFSMETTELAKQQILSQAASAMLAQANQTGQQVLHLLQQ